MCTWLAALLQQMSALQMSSMSVDTGLCGCCTCCAADLSVDVAVAVCVLQLRLSVYYAEKLLQQPGQHALNALAVIPALPGLAPLCYDSNPWGCRAAGLPTSDHDDGAPSMYSLAHIAGLSLGAPALYAFWCRAP